MRPASLSGLFAAFAILASATPVQAQFDPAAKVPPNPTQGIISPSGKFMAPVNSSTSNALPAKTPAEAEAALRQALHVQWLGSNTFRLGLVEFDKERRIVTLPARVCIRTQVVEYALVAETGKALGTQLAVKGFVRLALGEGVEKKTDAGINKKASSSVNDIYKDMVTNQLAQNMSRSGTLGLSTLFEKQLSRQFHASGAAGAAPDSTTAQAEPTAPTL